MHTEMSIILMIQICVLSVFYKSKLIVICLFACIFLFAIEGSFGLKWWSPLPRYFQVQYKMDCERVYGRILDNENVESSVRAELKDMSRKIWTEFYPEEPFELDYSTISSQKCVDVNFGAAGAITYDLVAAVQRQTSFYYQVGRDCIYYQYQLLY